MDKNPETFHIIGISVRTTNENGHAATAIPQLWNTFFSQNILEQIPNKIDNTIYSIYTDYEKDYTRPYTTILGCRVYSLDSLPKGCIAKSFESENYKVYTAKGKLSDGIVYNEWVKIWDSDLDRTYRADFEVYGEKAQDPERAEVDIYVGIK